jgi:DNA polymerase-3 subunit delta
LIANRNKTRLFIGVLPLITYREEALMEQLKRDIEAGTLGTTYVLYGDEGYLREHYLELMRKGTDEFDYKRLSGRVSAENIAEAARAFPMLSERTFVEVRDFDIFNANAASEESEEGEKLHGGEETLAELIADVPQNCRLVFVYNALKWSPDKRRKLWKTLEAKAKLVEFKPQSEALLVDWLIRRFKAEEKDISRETAKFLIHYSGNTMNALITEVGKISNYAVGREITGDDIRAVSIPQIEAEAFDLVNALTDGRRDAAARILSGLIDLETEPIPLIAALSWKARQLYVQTLRNPRNPKLEWAKNAILSCSEADIKCKSSSADKSNVLKQLFVELAV